MFGNVKVAIALLALVAWSTLAQTADHASKGVSAAATVDATTDVEATMKQMGLAYKEAMQANELPTLLEKTSQMSALVASVQAYQFAPEKQAVFSEGLNKVQQQLQLALNAKDLGSAKAALEPIAALRKEYHQQRSVSFWQLLFGH